MEITQFCSELASGLFLDAKSQFDAGSSQKTEKATRDDGSRNPRVHIWAPFPQQRAKTSIGRKRAFYDRGKTRRYTFLGLGPNDAGFSRENCAVGLFGDGDCSFICSADEERWNVEAGAKMSPQKHLPTSSLRISCGSLREMNVLTTVGELQFELCALLPTHVSAE